MGVETHLQLTLAVVIEVVPFLLLLLWCDTDLLGLMLVPFLLISVLTVAAVACRTIRVSVQLGTRVCRGTYSVVVDGGARHRRSGLRGRVTREPELPEASNQPGRL